MVEYLPRSAWNARPPNGGPGNLTVSRVEGAVIHWPGTGSTSVIHSKAAVASALRGWQDYHMENNPVGHHVTNIVLTEVGPDEVTARSKAIGITADGRCASLVYEDVVARTPDGWLISRRRVVLRRRPLGR